MIIPFQSFRYRVEEVSSLLLEGERKNVCVCMCVCVCVEGESAPSFYSFPLFIREFFVASKPCFLDYSMRAQAIYHYKENVPFLEWSLIVSFKVLSLFLHIYDSWKYPAPVLVHVKRGIYLFLKSFTCSEMIEPYFRIWCVLSIRTI